MIPIKSVCHPCCTVLLNCVSYSLPSDRERLSFWGFLGNSCVSVCTIYKQSVPGKAWTLFPEVGSLTYLDISAEKNSEQLHQFMFQVQGFWKLSKASSWNGSWNGSWNIRGPSESVNKNTGHAYQMMHQFYTVCYCWSSSEANCLLFGYLNNKFNDWLFNSKFGASPVWGFVDNFKYLDCCSD